MQLDELKKLQQQVQSAATEIESSVSAVAREAETGVHGVASELNAAAATPSDLPGAHGDAVAVAPALPAAPPVESGAIPRQASLPGLDRG